MRATAIYAYGAGCILAVYLVYAGLTALVVTTSNGGTVGIIEAAAGSFLPMLALMIIVFIAQRRLKVLAILPIPTIIVAAVALLFAMGSHWAPGFGDPLGIAHLVVVAIGLVWGARVLRRGGTNSGEPSNSTPHTDARASAVPNQSPSARAGERGR